MDRIGIETQQLATTLEMPLGKPVLVGGLTYVPQALKSAGGRDENAAEGAVDAETERAQLYLVLEVR